MYASHSASGNSPLDFPALFPHADLSRGCGARGDLGQLAPRKKLLKSLSGFPELSETLLALFGTEGFLFLSSALPFSLITPQLPGQGCHPVSRNTFPGRDRNETFLRNL